MSRRDGDPSTAMLRAAVLPALGAGGVVAAVSALWGSHALVGAGIGAVVAVLTVAVGPLVMRTFAQHSPPAVMAAAVGSYFLTVLVLGGVYVALSSATWLSPGHLGLALIICVLASMVGQTWVVGRLRLAAFGGPDLSPTGSGNAEQSIETAGQAGNLGAPHTRGD